MIKSRSKNNSGFKYSHKNTTVKITEDGTTIIANKDINSSQSLPIAAETGDKEYMLASQGKIKQVRQYNETTEQPTKDIDIEHMEKGKIEPPHIHDFVDGHRQDARYNLTSEELEIINKAKNIEVPEQKLRYYDIDEKLAQRALESYSFNDYKKGSETESYRANVDEAFDYADMIKKKTDNPEIIAKADYYADLYAKKYAAWINNHNSIQASVPSWFISGPANYNTRKHEKQQQRLGKSFEELDKINAIKERIKNLENYTPRTEHQGKAVDKGYNFENKHFTVKQNEELNRIQLFFNGKPEPEVRDKLKSHGFKWSPTNNAWQRQLTPNARIATEALARELDKDNKKD